jgi:hypothetical protein
MVDRQNLPRPAPELSEDGIPAIEELPESVLLTGDPVEGEVPPLDRPQAVKEWGTTASEQLGTETLERRLTREVPETATRGVDRLDDGNAGRQFLEPGADGGLGDDEPDSIAEAGVRTEDSLSAEEAAMSVVDEPPGLNYDPDPGYVDDDEEKR